MGQIYLVASGKGGVGKTTVTGNIAGCLAKSGNRVLCFDADVELKSLDLLLNKQDEAVFDVQDILMGRCDFEKALLEHDEIPNLFFIPAPSVLEKKVSEISEFILKLANEKKDEYDFVFIDCPAGLYSVEKMITRDTVLLLVATPDSASVRSAEKVSEIADKVGARARLIVNKIRPDLIKKGLAPNIDEVIDETTVRLIGIIPEEEKVLRSALQHSLIYGLKKSMALVAVENISARLCGADVPLAKLK